MNVKPFIDAAEILVRLDETERALLVLNNLPALWRDHAPLEVAKLKAEILAKITLPYDLLSDQREMPKSDEWSVQYLHSTERGLQLEKLVKDLNRDQIYPHIHEIGPGDFTFAIGLHVCGLDFSYSCTTMNTLAEVELSVRIGTKYRRKVEQNAVQIFTAFEIIEHLDNPMQIRQSFERSYQKSPEHVLLSTPRYTYSEGTPNWRSEGIHHLRAYCPQEFYSEVTRMFPEYNHTFIDNEVMVTLGVKK